MRPVLLPSTQLAAYFYLAQAGPKEKEERIEVADTQSPKTLR